MSLQSIAARARIEGMRALQQTVDRVLRRPSGGSLYLVRASAAHRTDESVWWSLDDPDAPERAESSAGDGSGASTPATALANTTDIRESLDRIAETMNEMAAQLAAYHEERAARLDAIEFLLKEVVLGGTASAPRPVVLGGVIEPNGMEAPTPDITIIADHLPLEVDTPVEVRSRFHDRWIYGFAIAEAIESGAGPCRYRLTRRSDGIPLPILFDACDVRAATTAFERNSVE